MANILKHRFVSAVTDSADPTLIQPSNWNDGHIFSGGSAGGMLIRDPTDATYGAKWLPTSYATASLGTTGVVNDYALGALGTLKCNNASLLTLTGVQAGVDGQLLRISAFNAQVDIPHQDARSLSANRFANFPANGTVSLSPGTWALYQYSLDYWRLVHSTGTQGLGGSLLFAPDGTYDIGAPTTTRPRDVNAQRDVNAGRNLTGLNVVTGASGVIYPASGGIQFPVTPTAQANANTLDDYREQTWTPVLTGSGGGSASYTLQSGTYIKVGRLAIITFYIQLSNKGTLAGSLWVTLPLTQGTVASTNVTYPIGWMALATTWTQVFLNVYHGDVIGYLQGAPVATANQEAASITGTDITNSSIFKAAFAFPTLN
jgi:hypothetical protein